jgi:hypothetical protein
VPTVKLRYDQRSKVLQPSKQAEWLQVYTLEGRKTNPDIKQKRKHSESCHAAMQEISMKVCASTTNNIASQNNKQATYYPCYGPVSL